MNINNINFTDSINTALSGDMRGFEFIYNQTYRYYRAMITKYFPNDNEVDDLLQDVYLKIFKKLKDLRAPENFFAWSKIIVKNRIMSEVRRRAGKMASNTEYRPMYQTDENGASLEDISLSDYELEYNRSTFLEEYDPELVVEKMERKKLIGEILDGLPEKQRSCILLWQEGYTTNEMAEALNLPANTVLGNIRYAKKKIKANVLDLEKKGIKLYGMSPLTFFFWILEQFDHSYADTLPVKGDMALWQQIGETIQQVAASISDAAPHAANSMTALQDHMQNFPSTAESVPASTLNNAAEVGTGVHTGTGSGAHSGTAHAGEMATATVIKGTATATAHTLIIKVLITVITVITIGTGGYFTYKHFTSNAFVDYDQETSGSAVKKKNASDTDALAQELGYHPLEKKTYETYWKKTEESLQVEQIDLKSKTYFAADFADLDSDGEDEFYVLFWENNPMPDVGNIMGYEKGNSPYNLCVYENHDNQWNSTGTATFPSATQFCDNFRLKFYMRDNKFYLYDDSTGGNLLEGYAGFSICEYKNEELNMVQINEYDDGSPIYWLNFIGSMYEEDIIKNRQALESYDITCQGDLYSTIFEFNDSFTFITKIYATSFVGAGNIYAYDTLEETGKLGPVKITFTDDENETYQFFTEEQLKSIRKQLRVPESDHITTTVGEQVVFWEGTGIKYVHVEFDDGEGYASADVAIEDAEVCTSISPYTLKDDY